MESKKEWFLTKELINVGGLPKSERGVLKKAISEEWVKRQKKGVRGKVYEYHYTSFPAEVIEALGLNISSQEKKETIENQWIERLKLLLPHETDFNQPQYDFNNINNILKIKEKTNCDLNWLLTGEESQYNPKSTTQILDTLGNPIEMEEFAFIPRYDIQASAGRGNFGDDKSPKYAMAFRKSWIKRDLSVEPEHLSVITVKGDSMEGVLENKDVILINHQDTTPRDGLYVLRVDDEIYVKRVQHLPSRLIISSSNEAYAPFEIDLNDPDANFKIIGKVVWRGQTL